jgi:hypothetical protein
MLVHEGNQQATHFNDLEDTTFERPALRSPSRCILSDIGFQDQGGRAIVQRHNTTPNNKICHSKNSVAHIALTSYE